VQPCYPRQDGGGQLGGERAEGGIACGVGGDAVPAQPRAEVSVAGRPGGVVAGKQPARRPGEAGENGARGGLERELADQGGEPGRQEDLAAVMA
jgi:hypothetical protein